MSEQVLDVKHTLRLLRRFWRTVAVFVLAGVAAGGGYVARMPDRYSARALVLLPSSGGSAETAQAIVSNSVTADAGIATSAAVLLPAGKKADPSLSLATLEGDVSASRNANGLLVVTASSVSPRKAEALANAVATGLVRFVTTGAGAGASSRALARLQTQSTRIAGQLGTVERNLAGAEGRLTLESPTSPAGKLDTALVATLTTEQASLTSELNSVKSQIAQAEFDQISLNQGTEVIQRATTASGRSRTSYLLYPAMGAIGGLFVGSVAVLAWRRRDPRLWTKDALARTVGAPVVLALEVPSRRTTREWTALLCAYRPSSSEKWYVRRALLELGGGDLAAPRLVLLALADDPAGVSQAVEVAVVAASSGMGTALNVVGAQQHAVALHAACVSLQTKPEPVRPSLSVRAGADPGARGGTAELAVTVFVVDRHQPQLAVIDRRGAETVISVSSGSATAEQLSRLAISAADSGGPVDALFLANPLPDDGTAGRVPSPAWPVRTVEETKVTGVATRTSDNGGATGAANHRRSATPKLARGEA